jgi:hypothetical protein
MTCGIDSTSVAHIGVAVLQAIGNCRCSSSTNERSGFLFGINEKESFWYVLEESWRYSMIERA